MTHALKDKGWIVAAMAVGALAAVLLLKQSPETKVEAVSTDRSGEYVLTTGYVDDGIEGVYYLDYLSGQLSAGVLSRQTRNFQALYSANVNQDLAAVLASQGGGAMPSKPNYIISTGVIDIMHGGGSGSDQPGLAAVYVAETNSGMVLVYVVPWNRSAHQAGQSYRGKLTLWTAKQFSVAAIRE